jgi:hypothetical protein
VNLIKFRKVKTNLRCLQYYLCIIRCVIDRMIKILEFNSMKRRSIKRRFPFNSMSQSVMGRQTLMGVRLKKNDKRQTISFSNERPSSYLSLLFAPLLNFFYLQLIVFQKIKPPLGVCIDTNVLR